MPTPPFLAAVSIPGSQPATSFPVDGAADFQCAGDLIEVLPLEPADLTPPQTSGQLGIEEVTPDFILCDDLHEHIQLLVRQYLLCPIAESGSGDLLGRVAGDQVRLLRRLQRTVERGVDAAHRTAGSGRGAV